MWTEAHGLPKACPRSFASLRTLAFFSLLLLFGLATLPATANPLSAVVTVRAEVPPDARTAGTLGTEREGGGVVISDDGLVLTIGYLILEAVQAEIQLQDGATIPAEIVAYDYDTGFGLLRPATPLNVAPIELGDSDDLPAQTQVLVAGPDGPSPAMVVSRREFAGYWEYLLDSAIFTAPPYRSFGGAALIGADGRLLGIGSLIVGDALTEGGQFPGNMFVPISLLEPIMEDLMRQGRAGGPAKPWLGLFTEEVRGRVFINRVSPDGPAASAGITENDIIVAVQGEPVSTLADFYRKVWALGSAGIDVPLTVLKGDNGFREVSIKSGDRYDYLKLNPTY